MMSGLANLVSLPAHPPAPRCDCDDGAGPAEEPSCRLRPLPREQGRLRWQVTTTRDCRITLPHYFFPVGWRATLEGVEVELGPDGAGLMRARIRQGSDGLLEVAFSMTPMRRRGLMVTAGALGAWLLLLALGQPRAARPTPEPGAASG